MSYTTLADGLPPPSAESDEVASSSPSYSCLRLCEKVWNFVCCCCPRRRRLPAAVASADCPLPGGSGAARWLRGADEGQKGSESGRHARPAATGDYHAPQLPGLPLRRAGTVGTFGTASTTSR
eukprot:GHVT01000709.1.p2 GENE.GHVT01000709.1~~GHVT01000709.1.p2  ORF type:complete len:123 (+),score=26.12 GHVT01000709.1:345-713(+)